MYRSVKPKWSKDLTNTTANTWPYLGCPDLSNHDYEWNECGEGTLSEPPSCQENADIPPSVWNLKIFLCDLWHCRFVLWSRSSLRLSPSWWTPRERKNDLYNRQRSFSASLTNLRCCSSKPWMWNQHVVSFSSYHTQSPDKWKLKSGWQDVIWKILDGEVTQRAAVSSAD